MLARILVSTRWPAEAAGSFLLGSAAIAGGARMVQHAAKPKMAAATHRPYEARLRFFTPSSFPYYRETETSGRDSTLVAQIYIDQLQEKRPYFTATYWRKL